MLASKNKLTKKKEIERVFQRGKASFDSLLGVKALANGPMDTRVVVVVSVKVSKKAVERNRIRRRLSEIIRLELPRLRQGVDIFVLTLPHSPLSNYSQLQTSLSHHFRRLGLYR